MIKLSFFKKGSLILVYVAHLTQAVAMEEGKSFATVHPTPGDYATEQAQILIKTVCQNAQQQTFEDHPPVVPEAEHSILNSSV